MKEKEKKKTITHFPRYWNMVNGYVDELIRQFRMESFRYFHHFVLFTFKGKRHTAICRGLKPSTVKGVGYLASTCYSPTKLIN
jgi:hypothetical protein